MTVSRISGVGRTMPAPNEAILERMARAGRVAMEENRNMSRGNYVIITWDQLSEGRRDELIIFARACYASLACNAGAKVKVIKENTS